MTDTLKTAVAERIALFTPEIRERVIDALVEAELLSQEQAITKGYARLNDLKSDLQKINRPDLILYDRAGQPAGEGNYSKDRADKIRKLEENIGRWEAALAAAWGVDKTDEKEAVPGDPRKLRELLRSDKSSDKSIDSKA